MNTADRALLSWTNERADTFWSASESSICSVGQARSGLKMGVRSPADVVSLWFCEAVSESGAEGCVVGPSVCLEHED
jgi:hypothetical protein